MDAVKYFKEKARMGKLSTDGLCTIDCDKCGLSSQNNRKGLCCGYFENLYPEEAVAIVEKWYEEHKPKTRAQVFFEKFPDAPRKKNGDPEVCAVNVGLAEPNECVYDSYYGCEKCWKLPAPDKYQDWSDK